MARWQIETVPIPGGACKGALDPDDRPVLACTDTESIWVGRDSGTGWGFQWIDTVIFSCMCRYDNLTIDVGRNGHLVFSREWSDDYRTDLWSRTTDLRTHLGFIKLLGPAVRFHASLIVGDDGLSMVAFVDEERDTLMFAREGPMGYTDEDIEPGGLHPSLTIDSSGEPSVTYFHEPSAELRHAQWTGAAWSIRAVDSGSEDVGAYSAMSFDASDLPVIGYYSDRGAIKYASHDGTDWNVEVVAENLTLSASVEIAVAGNGDSLIAWADTASDEIILARRGSMGWQRETVFSGSGVRSPSLAIDAVGEPAIAFSASDTTELLLARWNGSSWSIETVDVSRYRSALAFDAAGNPAIAYLMSNDVHLLSWNGSTWQDELVNAISISQAGPIRLRFDPSDRPVIAYASVARSWIRVARKEGGSWTDEVVQSGRSSTHFHLDLAIGGDGEPIVVYGAVAASRDIGGGWAYEYVGSGAKQISIAVDSTGRVAAAYRKYEVPGYKLRYAERVGRARLRRSPVMSLLPGWRATHLPLTDDNDDETSPWPVDTVVPGSEMDLDAYGEPLVLYRYSWSSTGLDGLNSLKLVKTSAGIELHH